MLDGTRKECIKFMGSVPLLIIDGLGMRKLSLRKCGCSSMLHPYSELARIPGYPWS
jgi:hypothetical protein